MARIKASCLAGGFLRGAGQWGRLALVRSLGSFRSAEMRRIVSGMEDMAEKFWVIFFGDRSGLLAGFVKMLRKRRRSRHGNHLTGQLFPHGLEVHANGGKNRDV